MAATTAKGSAAVPAKADYGLDAPGMVRNLATRGAMLFLLGLGLWYMNRETNPQGGIALFVVLGIAGVGFGAAAGMMVWSSRVAKLAMRERILDAVSWRGDEKVLDVGCGRGLMVVGAAKRLKTGRATGVDVWNAEDLSGNNAESAMANARAEGVATLVKIENSDARRLSYAANSFDVVVSSLAIHNISDAGERGKALDEMLRVVKPGGQILMWDVFKYGEYLERFRAAGAEVVSESGMSLLWCVPGKWFVVKKR